MTDKKHMTIEEMYQSITITKDMFLKELAYSKGDMKDPARWDEFIAKVDDAACRSMQSEIYIAQTNPDESLVRAQIKAVTGIMTNLKILSEETLIELFESLNDHGLIEDSLRDWCLYKRESLIEYCECWVTATGDKGYREKFWPKSMIEKLAEIIPEFTSINVSNGENAPFVTFCYKVFRCCYKQKYTRNQVRNWIGNIIDEEK